MKRGYILLFVTTVFLQMLICAGITFLNLSEPATRARAETNFQGTLALIADLQSGKRTLSAEEQVRLVQSGMLVSRARQTEARSTSKAFWAILQTTVICIFLQAYFFYLVSRHLRK